MTNHRLSIGIAGLDEILHGGLMPRRSYLVRGGPGTGKTTLGFHFLTTGVASSESTLFITFVEPEEDLRENAFHLGFNLDGINFLDLSPTSDFFTQVETYDIFSPSEVEREPITQKIIEYIEKLQPQRVFIDTITQFRYLSADEYQFRKQVLSFLRFLIKKGVTVVFTSEVTSTAPDDDLQFMSDGIIHLQLSPEARSLQITKFRGSDYQDGCHSFRLTSQGMEVFPHLIPESYKRDFIAEIISSGIPELDQLLHGGLERGMVTLITGPSGVGKTTLGLQFLKEAATNGERSLIYIFEESVQTLIRRCESINVPINTMIQEEKIVVVPVEPFLYTADHLARLVRQEVEELGTKVVMIDSISGYGFSIQCESLVNHLHALCNYLKNMGVTVILINELEMITGDFRITETGISYLVDNIIFMRYMERHFAKKTEIRKAIGVIKKRVSNFEKSLREIEISTSGIKVSQPVSGIGGVLTGVPIWNDDEIVTF
jgi:circadian clock protein KaiC